MARAIFICDFPPMTNLPPMFSDDGYQLAYLVSGKLRGGFSCIGNVPQAPTCLVVVDASEDVIDLMAADSRYLYIGDAYGEEG